MLAKQYSLILVMHSWHGCVVASASCFSRNIGQVTPKNIFYYLAQKHQSDQSILTRFYLILRTKSLLVADSCLLNLLGNATDFPVLPFSKLTEIFFAYFDPENICLENGDEYFSGWLYRYFGWKNNHCFESPRSGRAKYSDLILADASSVTRRINCLHLQKSTLAKITFSG